MTTSSKELIYIRVLKNSTYQICNADPIGYYFDGGRKDYTYPYKILTHFMPCYGPAHKGDNTAEFIRKIDWYKIMSAADIFASGDTHMITLFEQQILIFPHDRTNDRFHVFQLGEKTAIPVAKQKFLGANRGYFTLMDILE